MIETLLLIVVLSLTFVLGFGVGRLKFDKKTKRFYE